MSKEQQCRECGCVEDFPCVVDGVPCHWVERDLCSACAGKTKVTPERATIYSSHPLFPIVVLLRDTEAALVKARAEAAEWRATAMKQADKNAKLRKKATNNGRKPT